MYKQGEKTEKGEKNEDIIASPRKSTLSPRSPREGEKKKSNSGSPRAEKTISPRGEKEGSPRLWEAFKTALKGSKTNSPRSGETSPQTTSGLIDSAEVLATLSKAPIRSENGLSAQFSVPDLKTMEKKIVASPSKIQVTFAGSQNLNTAPKSVKFEDIISAEEYSKIIHADDTTTVLKEALQNYRWHNAESLTDLYIKTELLTIQKEQQKLVESVKKLCGFCDELYQHYLISTFDIASQAQEFVSHIKNSVISILTPLKFQQTYHSEHLVFSQFLEGETYEQAVKAYADTRLLQLHFEKTLEVKNPLKIIVNFMRRKMNQDEYSNMLQVIKGQIIECDLLNWRVDLEIKQFIENLKENNTTKYGYSNFKSLLNKKGVIANNIYENFTKELGILLQNNSYRNFPSTDSENIYLSIDSNIYIKVTRLIDQLYKNKKSPLEGITIRDSEQVKKIQDKLTANLLKLFVAATNEDFKDTFVFNPVYSQMQS